MSCPSALSLATRPVRATVGDGLTRLTSLGELDEALGIPGGEKDGAF